MIYEINYPKKYKNKLVCLVITLTYIYHRRRRHRIVVFYQMLAVRARASRSDQCYKMFFSKKRHFSYKEAGLSCY